MSININPEFSTESEHINHVLQFVGGTTAVTKVRGNGMTVAWSATGVVKVTWNENPVNFLGVIGSGFQATTASAVKGYTMTCPNALTAGANGSYSILLSIWNSLFAAADLTALQWLNVTFAFKSTAI